MKLKITLKLNTNADGEYIRRINPDYVIVATGSISIIPNIDGLQSANFYTAEDVLNAEKSILEKIRKGKTFIIGGSSVGLETAHFIAEQAYLDNASMGFINKFLSEELKNNVLNPMDITVVEMQKRVGNDLGGSKWILLNELKELGIKMMPDTKVIAVDNKNITIANSQGEENLPADNIILAAGYKSNSEELVEYLKENSIPYSVIGDAKKPRNIMEAIAEGLKWLRSYN